jgi:integrase
LIKTNQPDKDTSFWLRANSKNIRDWQLDEIRKRDRLGLLKPGDKTVHDNAVLVHKFYAWAKEQGFPVVMQITSNDWRLNFKDESLLAHTKGLLEGTQIDHTAINLQRKKTPVHFNKKHITIFTNNDIQSLLSAYRDPVYAFAFIMALATGMRAEGVCQTPYIGKAENHHIRPYPDIMNCISKGEFAKIFKMTVIEKGKKRSLNVNMSAWKFICLNFLPLYYTRRKLFEDKYPNENANDFFFLNAAGEPITPKMIADMTYIAKKSLRNFPWTFHSTRDWYATKFMIKNLAKKDIYNAHYDAAVEDALRRQLGHSDIKITYLHYIRIASIILANEDGMLDYSLEGGDFWNTLHLNPSKSDI